MTALHPRTRQWKCGNPSLTARDDDPRQMSAMSALEDPRLPAARAMAEGLLHTMRIAAALIEAGLRVDLSGLDDWMGQLCARALDLPPKQGALLIGDLDLLLAETHLLHESLACGIPREPISTSAWK